MFGKVKRWLGIEGVKVELLIPEQINADDKEVTGTLRFYSMHDQVVSAVRVRMVEKYKRGRRNNKLVDEYTIGEISLEDDINIPAHQYIDLDFILPFDYISSEMDDLQRKNFLLKGMVKTAKLMKGVKSIYRVEAEADVKGTALNPFDIRELEVIL